MLARLHFRSHHRARSLTRLAHGCFGKKYGALGAEHRLLEAYFKIYGNVAPSRTCSGRTSLSGEEVREYVAHVKPKSSAESGKRLLKLRKVESGAAALRPAAAEHATVTVVLGALFVVR